MTGGARTRGSGRRCGPTPEAAITGAGITLTEEDREFLRSVDWTLSDEELEALLEKRFVC